MLARIAAYVRGIAGRRRIDLEIDEELQFHVDQEIDAHVARGVPRVEARRLVLRDLGGLTQTKEAVRSVRTVWIDLLWRDARHAVRSLSASRAFTATAVIVLALSIGATTAIFSVVDAVILRGLPFYESERLVAVGEPSVKESSQSSLDLTTPQTFLDWRARQDVFSGLAAVAYAEISLKREGGALPENVRAQRVTADFFSILRTPPLLGRPFSRDDETPGRTPVAVISHNLWQARFGGRADAVGEFLPGQLASFEIVGVMPPGFTYPVDTYWAGVREPIDVWVPYVFTSDDYIRGNSYGYNLHVIGRLRDGVTLEQAQGQMDRIMADLAAETPRWFEDRMARVEPLHQFITRGVRSWMVMLLGAVAFVLLIACVNLANLMLVRAGARARELRIRAALGASRWDLSRVLLLESLLLAFAGGTLGVLLAWWGLETLRSAMPPEVPRAATIAVDMRVLLVTGVLAIVTGVTFGIAPVVQFTRPTLANTLRDGERTGSPGGRSKAFRAGLVVAEVAIAVVLLVGSGLFLASFGRVINVDLGLDHRDVVAVQVRVLEAPPNVLQASQRNRQLLQNVLERVRAIPGVRVASLAGGGLPLRGDLRTVLFAIPGRELPKGTDIAQNEISPDFFRAIEVPLLKGRFFTEADSDNSEPVVILNQAAADRYFAGDAIGRVVRVAGVRTVVGVVGNVRHDGPEVGVRTQAFVPLSQSRALGATLVVRTVPRAKGILQAINQAIASEFPGDLPAHVEGDAMQAYFDTLVAQRRFNMLLLSMFGVLGLVIACVGIYGVMAYSVSQRTQEIGIRMALGALPSAILISILVRASLYMIFGLAIGLASAWGLAEFVRGFLFEIQPHDPVVYAAALASIALTGLTASFVPACRAARVDPLVALRME
jgi:predicted permease